MNKYSNSSVSKKNPCHFQRFFASFKFLNLLEKPPWRLEIPGKVLEFHLHNFGKNCLYIHTYIQVQTLFNRASLNNVRRMISFDWIIYSSAQCNTEEIHTCCFKPNGTLLASGPVETHYETEIRIYWYTCSLRVQSTPSKNIQVSHALQLLTVHRRPNLARVSIVMYIIVKIYHKIYILKWNFLHFLPIW